MEMEEETPMELTDARWEILAPPLPVGKSGPGRKGRLRKNNRDVLAGILWILRTPARRKGLPKEFPPYQAHEKLPWVHIVISNGKRFLLGTCHGVNHKYLQVHLDEFCYRFDRRAWEPTLTSRLIIACLVAAPVTLAELKA